MKGVPILVFWLIAIPVFVSAQVNDFNLYQLVEADVKINSKVTAILGQNPYIEFYRAKSNIKPVNSSINQVVLSENYITFPGEAEIHNVNDSVQFTWLLKNSDKFEFKIISKVRVLNELIKVKHKINFPPEIIPEEIKPYTKETQYIDINPEIKAKANELVEGETDYYRAVFDIAEWVENNINYSLDTLTENAVQKSSWVIQNKYGVCDELTNLFISMVRSVGIPARFISGQAYSNVIDGFGNHGWSEVYFPGYGWIPFDITYKQFGWVDPSHIKIREQLDSGEPSIEYSWRSNDVTFEKGNISIETDTIQLLPRELGIANLSIEVLHNDVGPGSYVPIFIKIANPHEYYLPQAVFIRKSPQLTAKNSVTILLAPFEERNLIWIAKIPEDFDPNFLYVSTIEAADTYGDMATTSLKYGADFQVYAQKQAEEEASLLSPIPKKEQLPGIEFNCSFGKDSFYDNETVFASCIIENSGNTMLEKIKVCLQDSCKYSKLSISENTIVGFEFSPFTLAAGKKKFSIETDRLVKYDYKNLKLIEDPQLYLVSSEPENLPYGGRVNVTFHFASKSRAYNVTIDIYDNSIVEISELSGVNAVVVSLDTRDLPKDNIRVKVTYEDEAGRKFIALEKDIAKIYDRPFYALLLYHFRKVFGIN